MPELGKWVAKMKVTAKTAAEIRELIEKSDGSELVISLEDRIYNVDETIDITGKSNITIKGGLGTRLVGGQIASSVRRVTDESILSRINPAYRDSLYALDASSEGIPAEEELIRDDRIVSLTVNGKVIAPSQYPRRGQYIIITGYIEADEPEIDDGWGRKDGIKSKGIIFDDPHVRTWREPRSLWMNGFWFYDWMEGRDRVAELDQDKMIVKAEKGGDNIEKHFRIGQRMYFYNIIEELEPGTCFIDEDTRTVYFIPDGCEKPEEVIITRLEKDIFRMKNSSNITLDTLRLESSFGRAVHAHYCDDLTITNCEVTNVWDGAIELADGFRTRISGCTVHDTARSGISLDSGDIDTLTPGNSIAEKNHIFRIGRWQLCYAAGMSVGGVGNTLRNNLIHDLPHTAIFYGGNDLTIERNEMYSLIQDTGDSGAIYCGRDYTCRGNVMKENFIHHLGGVGIGAMGIYNDDCLSGTMMYRNVFISAPRACMLGGGRELKVVGNIFIGCRPAIELDSRGEPDLKIWRGIMKDLSHGVERHLRKSNLFIERYPETKEILDFFNAEEGLPHISPSAVVKDNVFCNSNNFVFNMGGISAELTFSNNSEIPYSDFEDADRGNFNVKNALAQRRGFEDIDMSKIGLPEGSVRDKVEDVFAVFEPTSEKLIFKACNRGSEKVHAKYRFSTNVPGYDLDGYEFSEDLEPGEMKTLEMPMSKDLFELVPNGKYDLPRINGLYKVLAQSSIPGERPAELVSEKQIFKFGS